MPVSRATVFEGPALDPPIPRVTLPRFVRERARHHPRAVALVEAASGREYTYGALDHLVGRCAAGLAAHGFNPGDVLLMFAPNLPEWPIAAPVAYVLARGDLNAADLKARVAERVVAYRQLGDVVLCEAIPKTAGKILRRVLRQQDAGRMAA